MCPNNRAKHRTSPAAPSAAALSSGVGPLTGPPYTMALQTGDALMADLGLLDCLDALESPSQQWLDDLLTDLPAPKSQDAPAPTPASQSWRSQGSCSQCGLGSSGPRSGSPCSCQHAAPPGKVPTLQPGPAPPLAPPAAAAAARAVRLPKPPQLPTLLDVCRAVQQPLPPPPHLGHPLQQPAPPLPYLGHPLQQRPSPFESQPMQPPAPVAAAPALPPPRPAQRIPAVQQQLAASTPRAGSAAGGLLTAAASQEALPASPAVAGHEHRMALLMRYFSLRRQQSQEELLSTQGSGVYVPRGQHAQQQHAQQRQAQQVEVLQTSVSAPASYTVLLRAEGSGVYVQGSMPVALPQRAPPQATCAGQPDAAAALQPRTSLKRSLEQALGQPQAPPCAPPRPAPIQMRLPAVRAPVAAGAGPCPRSPAALLPPSPFSSQLPVAPCCVTPANVQHPACPTSPAKRSPTAFARRPSGETHATAGSQAARHASAVSAGGPQNQPPPQQPPQQQQASQQQASQELSRAESARQRRAESSRRARAHKREQRRSLEQQNARLQEEVGRLQRVLYAWASQGTITKEQALEFLAAQSQPPPAAVGTA